MKLIDRSGSVLANSTSQVAAPARPGRKYLLIANLGDAVLWVNFGRAAAAAQPSIPLKAATAANDGSGGALVFEGPAVPADAVHVLGATAGKTFVIKEG